MIQIIISVIVGMFLYDIILKSIGGAIISAAFNNKDTRDTVKKTFGEQIEELKRQKEKDVEKM